MTEAIPADLGLGYPARPLGPASVDIYVPADIVFDVLSEPHLVALTACDGASTGEASSSQTASTSTAATAASAGTSQSAGMWPDTFSSHHMSAIMMSATAMPASSGDAKALQQKVHDEQLKDVSDMNTLRENPATDRGPFKAMEDRRTDRSQPTDGAGIRDGVLHRRPTGAVTPPSLQREDPRTSPGLVWVTVQRIGGLLS